MSNPAYDRKADRLAWMLERWGKTITVRGAGVVGPTYMQKVWDSSEVQTEGPGYDPLYDYVEVNGKRWKVGRVPPVGKYMILVDTDSSPLNGHDWLKAGATSLEDPEIEWDDEEKRYRALNDSETVYSSTDEQPYLWYRESEINIPADLSETAEGGGPPVANVLAYQGSYSMTDRDVDLLAQGDITGFLQWPDDAGFDMSINNTMEIDGMTLTVVQLSEINPGGKRLFFKWVARYGEDTIYRPPPPG